MNSGPLLARPAGANVLWLAVNYPLHLPDWLVQPEGKFSSVMSSPTSTAWNETSLPAGRAGEGSRIALATSNLKTSAHVGQADMGRSYDDKRMDTRNSQQGPNEPEDPITLQVLFYPITRVHVLKRYLTRMAGAPDPTACPSACGHRLGCVRPAAAN